MLFAPIFRGVSLQICRLATARPANATFGTEGAPPEPCFARETGAGCGVRAALH